MPQIEINIGGRTFEVACQDGEEQFLNAAAKLLDAEASVLTDQIGRMPEARMLLMAGLMLADKTAGTEDELAGAKARIAELTAQVERLQSAPAPAPERVEVPVLPDGVVDTMAELAARAEALAAQVSDRVAEVEG